MISVIVPAYNVEDYIEACLSSILNSTFHDIELIVVDDGSTDKTAELCDRLTSTDGRVRVIHQPNAGVAAARNAGLKASKGEFISFVDSDDVVHPRMIETLWNAISSGEFDMSLVLNRRIESSERSDCLNCPLENLGDSKPRVWTQQDYLSAMFPDFHGVYSGPCHKLFKRSLIFSQENNFIAFKPIPAEDTEWLVRVVLNMNKAVLIPLDLYFYLMRDTSLTHADTERLINPVVLGRLQTVFQILDLFPEDKPNYRALCLKDIYRKMLLYRYRAHGTSFEEKTQLQCKKIYKATIKEYLQLLDSPVEKMKTVLFHHCPWLHRWILNLGEFMVKHKLIRG